MVQYTIEARQLTNAFTVQRGEGPQHTTIEARSADEAITKFVLSHESELVSFTAAAGRESIATVVKDDSVFLVRIYSE